MIDWASVSAITKKGAAASSMLPALPFEPWCNAHFLRHKRCAPSTMRNRSEQGFCAVSMSTPGTSVHAPAMRQSNFRPQMLDRFVGSHSASTMPLWQIWWRGTGCGCSLRRATCSRSVWIRMRYPSPRPANCQPTSFKECPSSARVDARRRGRQRDESTTSHPSAMACFLQAARGFDGLIGDGAVSDVSGGSTVAGVL